MSEKTLKINIVTDASGLASISKGMEDVAKKSASTSASIEQISKQLEQAKAAVDSYADKSARAYIDLQTKATIYNDRIAEGGRLAGLAYGQAQASVTKYNNEVQKAIDTYSNLKAKMLEVQAAQATTFMGLPTTIGKQLAIANQTIVDNIKRKNALALKEIQDTAANGAAVVRTVINTVEQEEKIRAKALATLEADIRKRSNLMNIYMPGATSSVRDDRGYIPNASGTVAGNRATAAEARETQLLNQALAQENALRERLAISAKAYQARVAEVNAVIEANKVKSENANAIYQDTINKLTMTAKAYEATRLAALGLSQAQIQHIQSLQTGNNALQEHERRTRNLFLRVGEAIGAYRIWNGLLNATFSAPTTITKIGIELEATQSILQSTMGSAAGAAGAMKFLDQEAARTGITISTLRTSWRDFSASTTLAGMQLNTTAKMFSELNTVITALHLSSDRAQGVFNAMAQIFNKGKVQSEELVKQLGNLLPGAFASFAAATGRTTAELSKAMKKGEVAAKELIDFTHYMSDKFAASFGLASQGMNANIGRMQSAFTHLGETFYGLSSGAIVSVVKGITSLTTKLTDALAATENYDNSLLILKSTIEGVFVVTLGNALLNVTKLKVALSLLTLPNLLLTGLAAAAGYIAYMLNKVQAPLDKLKEAQAQIAEAKAQKLFENKTVDIEIRVDNAEPIRKARKELEDLIQASSDFDTANEHLAKRSKYGVEHNAVWAAEQATYAQGKQAFIEAIKEKQRLIYDSRKAIQIQMEAFEAEEKKRAETAANTNTTPANDLKAIRERIRDTKLLLNDKLAIIDSAAKDEQLHLQANLSTVENLYKQHKITEMEYLQASDAAHKVSTTTQKNLMLEKIAFLENSKKELGLTESFKHGQITSDELAILESYNKALAANTIEVKGNLIAFELDAEGIKGRYAASKLDLEQMQEKAAEYTKLDDFKRRGIAIDKQILGIKDEIKAKEQEEQNRKEKFTTLTTEASTQNLIAIAEERIKYLELTEQIDAAYQAKLALGKFKIDKSNVPQVAKEYQKINLKFELDKETIAPVQKEVNSILKSLNKETANALKGDKALYLEDARDRILLAAKGSIKALRDIEYQMKLVEIAYEKMFDAKQTAALINSLKTGFTQGFKDILNGTKNFGQAFKSLFDGFVDTIIDNSLNRLMKGFEDVFNDVKSGWTDIFTGLVQLGIASITKLFNKSAPQKTYSAAYSNTTPVIGTGAMAIADTFARNEGFAYQTKATIEFNKNLEKMTSVIGTVATNIGSISTWIGQLGSKLSSFSVVSSVANLFKPVTLAVSKALNTFGTLYNTFTTFINTGINAVTNFIGLTTAATAALTAAEHLALNNATAAAEGLAGGVGASAVSTTTIQKINYALAVIKFGYDAFTIWSDKYMSTMNKVIQTSYALSDGMASIGLTMMGTVAGFIPGLAVLIASAIVNVVTAGVDIFTNGISVHNISRLFFGMFGDMISALFTKPRIPNVWMTTENISRNQLPSEYYQDVPTYSYQGNKAAYIGESTPFGTTVISIHETATSAEEMRNAFGELLKTVKIVDVNLYNTINNLDEKMGQAGKTMGYFNSQMGYLSGIKTKQNASDLDSGAMLLTRYNWIVDVLGASSTEVGKYLNAWFDIITSKFISVSQNNAIFVLGVINSLATNLESFMQFPLKLVELIGSSVKSVMSGGTPDSVMNEIMGVLNTYTTVQNGLIMLGMKGNQSDVNNSIATFLANINAIGFAVAEAGVNLLAYGIALQKTEKITTDSLSFINSANTKFNSLKSQGLDNTQINAYFGSFGLMANLLAESKIAFTEANLDVAAQHIHKLSKSSVEVAKSTIDHAIATENLINVSRESAIATLVKSKKIEEATVAEAEYGLSIQKTTKDLLSQMGFIQQLGYLSGNTLGDMKISAESWINAAKNIVNVFGDMETAMKTLDSIAKDFLSPKDYAQYNLDTINRGILNIKEANPELTSITIKSVSEMIKSGESIASFINKMAEGNGNSAKQILSLIQLLQQKIKAKDVLAEIEKQLIKEKQDALVKEQEDILNNKISMLGNALSALTKSISNKKDKLEKIYQDELNSLKDQLDKTLKTNEDQKNAAKDLLSALQSTATSLKNAVNSTVIETLELTRERRVAAQGLLQSALFKAKSGESLANYAGLEDALSAIAKPSENLFSSFNEYAADQARTGNLISNLTGYANSQVSVAEQTIIAIDAAAESAKSNYDQQVKVLTDHHNANITRLDGILQHAQEQIDLLKGLDISVLTVAEALTNFNKSLDTSHISLGGAVVDKKSNTFYNAKTRQTVNLTEKKQRLLEAKAIGGFGEIYKRVVPQGLDSTGLDMLMDWAPGTSARKAANWKLPAFAVGVNEVPFDMTANIHKGERILPAADNTRLFDILENPRTQVSTEISQELLIEVKLLRQTVEKQGIIMETQNQIIADQSVQLLDIQRATKTTATSLEDAAGGRPLNVKVS